MSDHTVKLLSPGDRRILRVRSATKTVLEITYDAPVIDPPLSEDMTPMVEEEDFDFGLFLANVSRDRGRQDRLYPGC
jgi:hypothetical protein